MNDENKQPQIVVRLDRTALDAMFPEGSQARVDLSAAVVNNFVVRITDKNAHEIIAHHVATLESIVRASSVEFKEQIEFHAERAVASYFGPRPAWDHLNRKLSPGAQATVEALIAANFTSTIQQQLQKLLTTDAIQELVMEKLSAIIGGDVNAVQHNIGLMVQLALKERFS